MTWAMVIFLSVIVSIMVQLLTCVFPSIRSAMISENIMNLEKCILKLNQDAFQTGKIKSGSFIHDSFYIFLLAMLKPDSVRFPKISDSIYDKKSKRAMSLFDDEINSLDPDIKKYVLTAISSVSKILFLKYPIEFMSVFFKSDRHGHDSRMVTSGKLVTVSTMT